MPDASAPVLIVYPVADVDAAKATWSALLGTEPYADSTYYVGYRVGDLEIGLDPNAAQQGTTAPITYWTSDDLDASVDALTAAGATVTQPAHDVGEGLMVTVLADADGNLVGFRSA